jgi:hypothetical protein
MPFNTYCGEIGNDFNGAIHSINETSGRVKPSTDSTFAPGTPDHTVFKHAYETLYAG